MKQERKRKITRKLFRDNAIIDRNQIKDTKLLTPNKYPGTTDTLELTQYFKAIGLTTIKLLCRVEIHY